MPAEDGCRMYQKVVRAEVVEVGERFACNRGKIDLITYPAEKYAREPPQRV